MAPTVGVGLIGFGAMARKHLATMRVFPEVAVIGLPDLAPEVRVAAGAEGVRAFAAEAEFFAARRDPRPGQSRS